MQMSNRQAEDLTLVSMESIVTYRRGLPIESNQFDFLLGEWEARTTRYGPDGKEVGATSGTWRAQRLHGGRMILDEFVTRLDDGAEISYMATLRSYSPSTRRWEMTFLVAHQPQLIKTFSGTFVDGEARLEGSGRTLLGLPLRARVRFFDIAATHFQWENSVSLDDGATWHRDSMIVAKRLKRE